MFKTVHGPQKIKVVKTTQYECADKIILKEHDQYRRQTAYVVVWARGVQVLRTHTLHINDWLESRCETGKHKILCF